MKFWPTIRLNYFVEIIASNLSVLILYSDFVCFKIWYINYIKIHVI